MFSKDRKKIKGRGRLTYRPDRSRSRSQTPPHWRAEKRKTISLDEYEKLKVEKAKKMDEIERRAEDRRRRHEVWLNVSIYYKKLLSDTLHKLLFYQIEPLKMGSL